MSARVLHGFRTGFARVSSPACTGFARVFGGVFETRAASNLLKSNADFEAHIPRARPRTPLRGVVKAVQKGVRMGSARLFVPAFACATAAPKTHALRKQS